ncbi:MAG: lamin tail domain-containing protein [Methanomassiliicoccus sp.]|nr:MAG: lamin tail domain-containing protein [Methanomassiliicoccus sp.]
MLGLESDAIYPITFMSRDWQNAQDVVSSMVSTRASLGTREFGGILINELYSTQPSVTNDWVELYNTGPVPINIGDWTLYSGSTLIFTFPDVWIPSGGFYLTPLISLYKLQVFTLYDDEGGIIDSVAIPLWNARSYSRIGTPDSEYDTWAWTVPTPGEINQGQIPIPEFGEILAPLAIVPIIFLLIRRTRGARQKGRGEAEGSKHG